jgi:hypothetical protein
VKRTHGLGCIYGRRKEKVLVCEICWFLRICVVVLYNKNRDE